MTELTRRQFVQGSAATTFALGLASYKPFTGRPNEELRVAVIGLRGRGRAHINGLHGLPDVRVVALCDVDEEVLASAKQPFTARGEEVDTYTDLRRVIEREDIDIIATATPNHWHALITIWACQAGKDVYVEKPVSHNVWEGRQMVRAARKYERIVQTGTQSRSSTGITDAIAWIQAGNLGAIKLARGTCYKPRMSIGKVEGPTPVPKHIDYDLWTGPAPLMPLMRKNLHYDWHWVFDTGCGDLGNQGVHQMDMCRWAIGAQALPKAVISAGGRFGYDDDGNTPNTQMIFFDYAPAPIVFEVRGLPRDEAAREGGWGGGAMDRVKGMSIGVTVECERGYLTIPNYSEAFAYDEQGEQIQAWKGGGDHFANFIAAVRSREIEDLSADIAEGHLSSALCHLGNASYLMGTRKAPEEFRASARSSGPARESYDRMCAHLDANGIDPTKTQPIGGAFLDIDPETERFVDNEAANMLLTRVYRKPFVVPEEV